MQGTYVVAIPSYGRPETLRDKTLKWLLSRGVAPEHIHVFVADAKEAAAYRAVHHQVVIGKKGITPQRRFIAHYFPQGTHVVSIDDDVEGLYECKDTQQKPVLMSNVDQYFIHAFEQARRHGAHLWGVYPVLNPFYMKPGDVSTSLKFILGTLYGFIVRHDPSLMPKLPEKEDVEQSILYYLRDGKVLRFNDVAIKTRFHNPKGGLGGLSPDRLQANEYAANELKRRYPDLGYVWHRKTTGVAEFRFYANTRGVPKGSSVPASQACTRPCPRAPRTTTNRRGSSKSHHGDAQKT